MQFHPLNGQSAIVSATMPPIATHIAQSSMPLLSHVRLHIELLMTRQPGSTAECVTCPAYLCRANTNNFLTHCKLIFRRSHTRSSTTTISITTTPLPSTTTVTTIRHHGDRPCSFPRSLPCLVLPLWVADLFHELDSPGTCHWCQFSSWWLYTKIATPTSEATVAKQATSLREQLEAAQENPTSQEKTIKSHEASTRHLTKERSAATETGARCQNECGLFKLRL
jgi:hypothetical protein